MAEWSDEEVLQFINYYEEMTVLWYAKHPCHFDKIRHNDAWIEIAQKTGKSVEECKRKMTSLLASMRKEKATRMPFIRRQPPACFDLVDCCDLDLDPLTFISFVDLDMIVTYLHAKNLINRSSSSKVMVG